MKHLLWIITLIAIIYSAWSTHQINKLDRIVRTYENLASQCNHELKQTIQDLQGCRNELHILELNRWIKEQIPKRKNYVRVYSKSNQSGRWRHY